MIISSDSDFRSIRADLGREITLATGAASQTLTGIAGKAVLSEASAAGGFQPTYTSSATLLTEEITIELVPSQTRVQVNRRVWRLDYVTVDQSTALTILTLTRL